MPNEHRPTVLIATSNPGKRTEIRRLLPPEIDVVSLDDFPVIMPAEDGASYAEIATRKARTAADQTGLHAIADDSGLEVEALNGAPGLRTARFGGEPPSDEQNRAFLLRALAGIPLSRRGAVFRCAVALAVPGRLIALTEGSCSGMIGTEFAGESGFGYDPLFVISDGRTLAELSPDEKDRVSHRGRAVRLMLPHLLDAIVGGRGAAK